MLYQILPLINYHLSFPDRPSLSRIKVNASFFVWSLTHTGTRKYLLIKSVQEEQFRQQWGKKAPFFYPDKLNPVLGLLLLFSQGSVWAFISCMFPANTWLVLLMLGNVFQIYQMPVLIWKVGGRKLTDALGFVWHSQVEQREKHWQKQWFDDTFFQNMWVSPSHSDYLSHLLSAS